MVALLPGTLLNLCVSAVLALAANVFTGRISGAMGRSG
jgi:hypothetical protein